MARVRLDIMRPHDAPMEPSALQADIARRLGVKPQAIEGVVVQKRELDARRKLPKPSWRLTVDANLQRPARRKPAQLNLREAQPEPPPLESPVATKDAAPVIVVGAGPAGLFASLHLAQHGARVTLIERGKPVETRARDFGQFRGRGILDTESNLCFGEGGAGTYSDGKLTCRTKDPLRRQVLHRLVAAGAPARILVDAKPHIGTNLLFRVLKNMRAQMVEAGVRLQYETRVDALRREGAQMTGVRTTAGDFDAPRVLLATGHSARDTYEALLADGIPMQAKPFAVGVRAEHPQRLVDQAQYRLRNARPTTLPPADYRLAHTVDDRGVYSFCMCPGGMIVPTATEPGMVVVNGMSTARRSTPYANSGLVAQVNIADLERLGFGGSPLAGIEFQRWLERRAFEHGGGDYRAPAMRASDLIAGRASGTLGPSNFRPGLTAYDLRDTLPDFVVQGLRQGLQQFDRQLNGYGSQEATLIAVESRTSSPIRIPRDDTHQVEGHQGLFVAGEGPGYAGGIMSAAIDGIRTADAILRDLST
ncbi:MAG: FAD-dependent oxidoreductase [Myxococcota bacterium]